MTKGNDPISPIKYFGEMDSFGLTKREYFATMAMQGLLTELVPDYLGNLKEIAQDAVRQADFLIEALNEEKT